MKKYLVGGAVRDHFLRQMRLIPQSSVADRDWVVVGETAESMLAAGFLPVGKSFPVFLHPETKEEYALARRERKVAPGHQGFAFEFDPSVTLEEDLRRRDLTINAMAAEIDDVTGAMTNLVDPLNGRHALVTGELAAVDANAFGDDPLRLYRLARMAAKLPTFTIEENKANEALRRMALDELRTLSPERVFAEANKAMIEPAPSRFFWTLAQAGALGVNFTAIEALLKVRDLHVEGNVFLHTMLALDACVNDPIARWMVLYHDVGKARTDPTLWPRHHGHEDMSGPLARAELAARLHAPASLIEDVVLFARVHMKLHRWRELRASTVLDIIESAKFSSHNLISLFMAADADEAGRLMLSPLSTSDRHNESLARSRFFFDARDAAEAIQGRLFVEKHGEGPKIGNLVHEARVNAIKAIER